MNEYEVHANNALNEPPQYPFGQNTDLQVEILKPTINPRRFIRNTNWVPAHSQIVGNCYAYAACSAYINTANRIYGLDKKKIPTFNECYKIVNKNPKEDPTIREGGSISDSIEKLENKFQLGIQCDKETRSEISIKEVMTISVVLCFSTSSEGYENVGNGELLYYKGQYEEEDWHATLVEGYSFEKDCYICKNSWFNRQPYFYFTESAAHDYYFIRVYFTIESIRDKNYLIFEPKIKSKLFIYNKEMINCVLMDDVTSNYSTEYVCISKYNDPIYNNVGVTVEQYIKLMYDRFGKKSEYLVTNEKNKKKYPPIYCKREQSKNSNYNNNIFQNEDNDSSTKTPYVICAVTLGALIYLAFRQKNKHS